MMTTTVVGSAEPTYTMLTSTNYRATVFSISGTFVGAGTKNGFIGVISVVFVRR